jgi:hypothetical protein
MKYLETLSVQDILSGPLPIKSLLEDSFYYPCSALDGRVVKWYSKSIQSFVYCDYAISEERFLNEMDTFLGYTIVAQRAVKLQELVPNGWYPVLPRGVSASNYFKYKECWVKPFCRWVVYERDPEHGDDHGAFRFSLLFIGGEGVATYQALYWSNRLAAKAIGIIRPGDGFGLNWTQFGAEGKPFHQVLMENPYGTPEIILRNCRSFSWSNYKDEGEIQTNDRFTGVVKIVKKVTS